MPASSLANIEQTAARTPPTIDKPKRIPANIIRGCELLNSGECKTITAAAARIGVSRDWLSRMVNREHVRVFIERRVRQNLTAGTMRSGARVMELVDASSEHVSFDAAKFNLALAGIKPAADAQVSVNIDIKAGYVIDLSDDPRRVIDGASTIDQAQVIDNTEVGA